MFDPFDIFVSWVTKIFAGLAGLVGFGINRAIKHIPWGTNQSNQITAGRKRADGRMPGRGIRLCEPLWIYCP